jgi:hypothetical protein
MSNKPQPPKAKDSDSDKKAKSKETDNSLLIDGRVPMSQATLAVNSLKSYHSKKASAEAENNLLPRSPNEEFVWLQIGVKKIPPDWKFKPIKMYVFFSFSATRHG